MNLVRDHGKEPLVGMESTGGSQTGAQRTIKAFKSAGSAQMSSIIDREKAIEGNGMSEVAAKGGNGIWLRGTEAAHDTEIAAKGST